ncbi:tryptophan synthase subunit alpha [bacterium SCSIO 12696]|nr:tryptophan synthase subunit alpha [bacterium SCSIO 12696]
MNRIKTTLDQLQKDNKKALVTYIVAGDPEPAVTVDAMHALVASGADILELGIPFSDPMAEGPVIQLAHERALKHSTSLRDALAMVTEFRRANNHTPIILMGYANPIEKMGYSVFADAAKSAGVDGVLTVDLPPEESAPFTQVLKQQHLENIFLIAPTTTARRQQAIVEQAGGFIYYVSLKGVTGAGHLDVDSVEQKLGEIRSLTQLPICVGFGIKDGATARAAAACASGVVVGSAIVSAIAATNNGQIDSIKATISDIVGEIRSALDS